MISVQYSYIRLLEFNISQSIFIKNESLQSLTAIKTFSRSNTGQ